MSETNKYLIVLFKNKEKRKIINKFKTFDRATTYFKNLIKENDVIFDKKVENGLSCEYELGLVSFGSSIEKNNFTLRDDMGRLQNVNIDGEYNIIDLKPFKLEEHFYDVTKNKKISYGEFEKEYLKTKSLKLISKLNNKIVIQNDEKINLFSFKCSSESMRFIETLTNESIKYNRVDLLIVSDTSKEQKKYLYKILELNGIEKSKLYRRFTTYSKTI